MGAFTPSKKVNDELEEKLLRELLKTFVGLKKKKLFTVEYSLLV